VKQKTPIQRSDPKEMNLKNVKEKTTVQKEKALIPIECWWEYKIE
jgi:hypothetical protein